jgi:hypothetical protein
MLAPLALRSRIDPHRHNAYDPQKRTRVGVEINHERPALVELPQVRCCSACLACLTHPQLTQRWPQNLGGSPDAPEGHVVALDGYDGVPAVDVAASIAQITAALQAPMHQDHEQHAPEPAADDPDATPSFTPRTPPPRAKVRLPSV